MGTPERTDNQEKLPNILGLATPKPERSAQQPKPARQPGKSYLTFLHLADKTPTRAWRMGAPGATERRRRTKRQEPAKRKAKNAEGGQNAAAHTARARKSQRTPNAIGNDGRAHRAKTAKPEPGKTQRAPGTTRPPGKSQTGAQAKRRQTTQFFLAVKRPNRQEENELERKRTKTKQTIFHNCKK